MCKGVQIHKGVQNVFSPSVWLESLHLSLRAALEPLAQTGTLGIWSAPVMVAVTSTQNRGSGWRSVAEGVVWGAGAHTQALYASRKWKVGSVQFYKLLSVLSGKIFLLFFFHLLTRVESGVSETMCMRLGPIKNQTFYISVGVHG